MNAPLLREYHRWIAENDLTSVPRATMSILESLGHRVTRGRNEIWTRLRIESQQFQVLGDIDLLDGAKEAFLADALGFPLGELATVVDELVHRGLVERRADGVYITPSGCELRAEADQLFQRKAVEFLEPLSEDERTTLARILWKLRWRPEDLQTPRERA